MELWDLYTREREKTGQTMVRGEKRPEGLYTFVVHVCIFNSRGQMLIQQRQPFKRGWSGLWDVSMGGSGASGDNSQTAVERELREELGIDMSFADIRPNLTVNFEGGFDDFYLIEREVEISKLVLQPEEVKAVKWASLDEICKMIDDGTFIPYYKTFIDLLFQLRGHVGVRTRPDDTKPAPQP